ncbi:SUMF1/EgtB/PvdO family nonheme iron enzyme [Pseudonocardia sp. DLS-67]
MRQPLTARGASEWLRLANLAAVDIAVVTGEARDGQHADLPVGPGIDWNGDVTDIRRVARWIADVEPYLAEFPRSVVPTVVPIADAGVGGVCATSSELVRLLQAGHARFVAATPGLIAEIRDNRPARSREAFALRTVVNWSFDRRDRIVAELPLRILGLGANASAPISHSLHDLLSDPRTASLVTVIGEPGSGKTLQLRQLNAQCALDVLRSPENGRPLETFYAPLFDHPPGRAIDLAWVEECWNRVVDSTAWCTFPEFLADGGAVILDGYNEVGAHSQALTQWMLEWRAVVAGCFQLGARRVVVSCRTRDQLIPLHSARGEEPTAVELSPVTARQIVAIAAGRGVDVALDVRSAITEDPELAEFYSSPFRLQTYLDAGVAPIARTDARLFGNAIAAAILRERDQLHFHPRLLPERAIAALVTTQGRSGADPWPLLADVPLIRVLAGLARTMSRPADTAGRTLDRVRTRAAIADGLQEEGLAEPAPAEVLDVAIDLHMLVEDERRSYGFSHRIVRQLLAALTMETDRVLELIHATAGPGAADAVPGPEARDSAGDTEGMASAAAQLHGEDFTLKLAAADPVLAARAHTAARLDGDSETGRSIRLALRGLLSRADTVVTSIDAMEALAGMGWKNPAPRRGDPTSAMHRVPGGEWRLGPGIAVPDVDLAKISSAVASERRTIELKPFWIADVPVTNAEYAEFVAAGGYHERELWTDAGWDWRSRRDTVEQFVLNWMRKRDTLRGHPERIVRLLRDQLASPAQAAALVRFMDLGDDDLARYAGENFRRPIEAPRFWSYRGPTSGLHPVIGISWHEANAFCAWKSLELGELVRLPSEDEWEAACVWRLGRAPLDGPINSIEYGVGGTSPVGAFEAVARPGVEMPKDLMGNCFEWTFDYYRPGDHIRRVVKGGSWRQEKWRAHPAYRGRGDVNIRTDDVGLRYVVGE